MILIYVPELPPAYLPGALFFYRDHPFICGTHIMALACGTGKYLLNSKNDIF